MMLAQALVSPTINIGIDNGGNTQVLVRNTLLMVMLALGAGACSAGVAHYATLFSQGTAWWLRVHLYDKITSFSVGNFDQHRTGQLMVNLNTDVTYVAFAVQFSMILLLFAPFMVIVAFILALATLAGPGLDDRRRRGGRQADHGGDRAAHLQGLRGAAGAARTINNAVQEDLTGIRVVKAFVREELENAKFQQRTVPLRNATFAAPSSLASEPLLQAIGQLLARGAGRRRPCVETAG